MVFDSNGAGGRRRPPADVAPVNPRMALLPTARALGGDDGEIIHGSWDLLSIGKGASDPAPWNVGRRLRCRGLADPDTRRYVLRCSNHPNRQLVLSHYRFEAVM